VHTTDAQALLDISALRRHQTEAGAAFPRIVLFLLDWPDAMGLHATLARIPASVVALLAEIVVLHDGLTDDSGLLLVPPGSPPNLRLVRVPRRWGYGGMRKVAFEHALAHGFDHAVVLPADGMHPPEALPSLLRAAVIEGSDAVFAWPIGATGTPGAIGATEAAGVAGAFVVAPESCTRLKFISAPHGGRCMLAGR